MIQNTGFYRGMAEGFVGFDSSAANNFIKIYQNLANMPADADNWSIVGNSADELVTFNNYLVTVISTTTITGGKPDPNWGKVTFSTAGFPNPATINATASGTAAWYAMYDSTGSQQDIILGEVSLSGGNGTLQIDALTLTIGNPITILDWGFTFRA